MYNYAAIIDIQKNLRMEIMQVGHTVGYGRTSESIRYIY